MSKGVPIAKVAKIPSLVNYPTSKMATIRTRCCDTGRPVMADPMTGTTICSCQLQTGIPAYLSRVPSLPETVYGTGTGHPFLTSAVVETTSPFYQMYAAERQTESRKTAPSAVQSAYYYDHVMAAHPYGNFFPGFDLNGARRKNATRENTNALKAWLHQHRKNPYPTKGEKIMLAVMTQMTLTQVSTWFANARRRLKKDCKIDGKEIDLSDIESDETKDHNDSMVSRLSDSESDVTATTNNLSTDLSDISDAEEQTTDTKNKSIKKCVQRLFSPDRRDELFLERISSPEVDTSVKINSEKVEQHGGVLKSTIENVANQNQVSTISRDAVPTSDTRQTKRKIWSISEIIG